MAGAGGDDLAGAQGDAELSSIHWRARPAQPWDRRICFCRDRRSRFSRKAISGFSWIRSSHRQFAVVAGPSTNKCAQALSAMICAAPALTNSENRELGISIAGLTLIEHLLHRVGLRSAAANPTAKRNANSGSPTRNSITGHRCGAAVRDHGLSQDASGHRTIDIDMFLAGFAGGRDLPAEQIPPDEYCPRSPPESRSPLGHRAVAAMASSAPSLVPARQ